MLSPQLLELLRLWWREGKRQNIKPPHRWLFPGRSVAEPASTRQINRAVHKAVEAASNGAELWRRLKQQGFRGSLRVVGESTTRCRRDASDDGGSFGISASSGRSPWPSVPELGSSPPRPPRSGHAELGRTTRRRVPAGSLGPVFDRGSTTGRLRGSCRFRRP